jgi:hypothetical protein
MTPGEPLLDRFLALDEPVHGRVERVLVGVGDAELLGARMRSATMAATSARSCEALASISLSKPSRRMAPSTASTWPWARERTTSRPSSTGPSLSPFRMRRIASICSIGSDDRLASVRFLTRLPSRTLSRSR